MNKKSNQSVHKKESRLEVGNEGYLWFIQSANTFEMVVNVDLFLYEIKIANRLNTYVDSARAYVMTSSSLGLLCWNYAPGLKC